MGKVKVVESFIGFVSHTIHSKFPQLPLESKSRQEKRWSAGELMQCWVEEVSFCHFSANSQFTSLIAIFARTKIAQMKNSPLKVLASFCSGYFADISGRDLDGCSDTNVAHLLPMGSCGPGRLTEVSNVNQPGKACLKMDDKI